MRSPRRRSDGRRDILREIDVRTMTKATESFLFRHSMNDGA
jgi:hypothetical protein